MHDIDTTRLEYNPELEQNFAAEAEAAYEGEMEIPMSEAEEEALAAELLGVTNEAEMDQFLGGLFRKITRKLGGAASQFMAKHAGPLAGALKGIAARGLPFLTGALGSAIPIPGVGTALGAAVGKAAANLLQSEMEQLEADEQEFELARRYVRLASHAIHQGAGRRWPTNPAVATNLALRGVLQRWRRSPRYYQRSWSSDCPPCPSCPPYPQEPDPSAAGGGEPDQPMNAGAPPAGAPGQEFEFQGRPMEGQYEGEEAGEFGGNDEAEAEGQSYETNFGTGQSAPAHRHQHRRSGQWVRQGHQIILHGV